jgi:hypothetical protein
MVVSTTNCDHPAAAKRSPKLSRSETSRRNGSKSRGPRTQAGKERSRFNAVTHGMTAQSDLLPAENPDDFQAGRLGLRDSLNPRSALEAIMVDRIARNAWHAERAERAAEARLDFTVNHEALDRAHAQNQQVISLSQLLLADLFERAFIPPEARAGGAEHPAQLVALLETTIPGCDWLLGRLRTLECYRPRPGAWVEIHGFQLARLMGFYATEFATEYAVAYALLASEVVTGDTKVLKQAQIKAAQQSRARAKASAEGEARTNTKSRKQARDETTDDCADVDIEQVAMSMGRVVPKREFVENLVKLRIDAPREMQHMQLDRFVPDNVVEARQRLAEVIGQMIERLESIRAVLVRVAEADALTAAARLEADLSHDGELQHRYIVARDRALIRSIDTFYKLRKADNDGAVENNVPDSGNALIPGPSPEASLPEASSASSASPVAAVPESAAPHPGVSLWNGPQHSAMIPPIIAERLTQTVFGKEFGNTRPRFRNEPEKPSPAAEPEPSPEPAVSPNPPAPPSVCGEQHPQSGHPEPPIAATTNAPQQRAAERPSGPTRSDQLATDNGPSTKPCERGATDDGQRTIPNYPPRPPENWELIPETSRGDFERYKDYQRKLEAAYGVSSPDEFRRKHRTDPPLG